MGCYCISCTWSFQESRSRRYKNVWENMSMKQLCQNWDSWTKLTLWKTVSVFFSAYQLLQGMGPASYFVTRQGKRFLFRGGWVGESAEVNNLLSKLELQRKGRKCIMRWWGNALQGLLCRDPEAHIKEDRANSSCCPTRTGQEVCKPSL